jgi:PAS domain S-box-containing protein
MVLTWSVVLALALIGVHEVLVLMSPPVPLSHHIVHLSLLVIGVSTAAGLWAFCAAYRSLSEHQRLIEIRYMQLDRTVQEKTRDLIASKSLLESLFDAVQDRMVVINSDGTIVHANSTATADAGHDPCGRHFGDIFPDCRAAGERRSRLRIIENTFRTGMPQRNRLMKGGETCSRVLEINTFPVFNDAGDVQLVVEVARDVTEEKEDQALASHYEKMAALGLLAAGIAHDLGNPLASLSSELQMLKQEECDIERMRKSLETLERHIARITDSLRDILGFAGKRTDRSGRASVQSAIDDALRLLRYDPRARSVRFEVDVLHNVPHITMRENDLILVLLNVMVNAIDAMPTGGHVRVYIRDVDLEHIVLAIEDTGTGMDADTLERATQPLFTTKAETGGTGLGLAVASTLMDRVGGALAIRSAPGKGSTVTLRLPLRRPPECQDDAA